MQFNASDYLFIQNVWSDEVGLRHVRVCSDLFYPDRELTIVAMTKTAVNYYNLILSTYSATLVTWISGDQVKKFKLPKIRNLELSVYLV